MPHDELNAFLVVDANSRIEALAGGVDSDNRYFGGAEMLHFVWADAERGYEHGICVVADGQLFEECIACLGPFDGVDDEIVAGVA